MDVSMTEEEKRRFDAWVHSPTVSSKHPDELVIAFKISKILNLVPSKVLKALRTRPGADPETIRKVEACVDQEPNLTYQQLEQDRLVKLANS